MLRVARGYPIRKGAMRIRLLQMITGSFHGVDGGVARGQVVDVDDVSAARYVKSGVAELVKGGEEHAVIDDTGVESAVVKPRRGRPKKDPDWHEEKAPGWKDASPE
jgi:hypothetical protein